MVKVVHRHICHSEKRLLFCDRESGVLYMSIKFLSSNQDNKIYQNTVVKNLNSILDVLNFIFNSIVKQKENLSKQKNQNNKNE
jgi:hypothetical protein